MGEETENSKFKKPQGDDFLIMGILVFLDTYDAMDEETYKKLSDSKKGSWSIGSLWTSFCDVRIPVLTYVEKRLRRNFFRKECVNDVAGYIKLVNTPQIKGHPICTSMRFWNSQ